MNKFNLLAVAAATMIAAPAVAQITPGNQTITTLSSPVPAGTSWGVVPGENSGGGSAAITAQNVNDTDGSLNITGDRSRVQTGVQYGGGTNTGVRANAIVDFTADYFVNAVGGNSSATPAFRVLIQDGSVRSELIWEGSYNGNLGLGAGSADAGDSWRQFVNGVGPTFDSANPGAYLFNTLAGWGNTYSTNAFVSGLSVGAGSGAPGFNANVDNVGFVTDAGTTRYNFAVTAAAVPEPATWAMMMFGMGMVGFGLRRRKSKVTTTVSFA